jgi:hypothetical protein
MSDLTREQATRILRRLGWRVRNTSEYTKVVKRFQAGWNLGDKLVVDGKVGPLTSAALRLSESRRRAGKTTASPHFSFSEVACRCGGENADCKRIWTKRRTFRMMEKYRRKSGLSYPVVSGCRCPTENASVGGVSTSFHLKGRACDVQAIFPVSTVKDWHVATHIGFGSSSGHVKHIDIGSGATLTNPDVFVDGL